MKNELVTKTESTGLYIAQLLVMSMIN